MVTDCAGGHLLLMVMKEGVASVCLIVQGERAEQRKMR